MRVLLISNLFPDPEEPTRGIFNLHRFGALARHCEVTVISPRPWWVRRHNRFACPEDRSTGIHALYPPLLSLPGTQWLHGAALALSLRSLVRKLHRTAPYDAVLAAWAYPDGAAAAVLANELGLPLVSMVLGSDVNDFPRRPGLRRRIAGGLLRARTIIAVSRALRERVIELGVPAERVIVQHNCVDGERFAPMDRRKARRHLGLAEDGVRVLYVGNFAPEKGPAVLLDALASVPGALLSLVGGGPLESWLRARAAAADLVGRVEFHGRRPHSEIPDWLGAADALCLPSFREGCPNVVLEALASGRPVVGARVGGVPELLDDTRGALFAPGDSGALAASLTEVLSRNWDADHLRAGVAHLSWDQYGETLFKALEDACNGSPGA